MRRRLSKVVMTSLERSIGGKFNHDLAMGYAHLEGDELAKLLDEILYDAFSPEAALGIIYLGSEPCAPEEAVNEIHRASNSSGYDISRSDMYTVRYTFKIGNETIHRYRWMPIIGRGNLTVLGGSWYNIRPVITDKTISPGAEKIFIRLLRDKIGIGKMNYAVNLNGLRLLDMSVPMMRLFKTTPPRKATNCKITVVLYLLGRYGLRHTLALFGVTEYQIVPVAAASLDPNSLVYTSSQFGTRTEVDSIGKDIAIILPAALRSKLVDQLMTNLFYLLDYSTVTVDQLDQVGEWQRLLGKIMYGERSTVWLTMNIRRHFDTLTNAYVPPVMKKIIKDDFGDTLEIPLKEDAFFQLLMVTFKNYDLWASLANEISATAYDKRISVSYFILYNTITRVNKIAWELAEAKTNGQVSEQSILKLLRKYFTLRGMYRMTERTNISVQAVTHHNSCYVYNMSTSAALQLNTGGSTGAQTANNSGPPIDGTTLLHESHLSAGTLSAIGSSRMSPLSTLNVYAPVDRASMTIVPNQSDLTHLASIREVLLRTPHRALNQNLPKAFNRYVEYPKQPPRGINHDV